MSHFSSLDFVFILYIDLITNISFKRAIIHKFQYYPQPVNFNYCPFPRPIHFKAELSVLHILASTRIKK